MVVVMVMCPRVYLSVIPEERRLSRDLEGSQMRIVASWFETGAMRAAGDAMSGRSITHTLNNRA